MMPVTSVHSRLGTLARVELAGEDDRALHCSMHQLEPLELPILHMQHFIAVLLHSLGVTWWHNGYGNSFVFAIMWVPRLM